jgi:hypothetical protein
MEEVNTVVMITEAVILKRTILFMSQKYHLMVNPKRSSG